MEKEDQKSDKDLLQSLIGATRALIAVCLLFLMTVVGVVIIQVAGTGWLLSLINTQPKEAPTAIAKISAAPTTEATKPGWIAPDFFNVSDEAVRYGRELIANTSSYLGPKGKVAVITNGMNCQNCHLDAGTRYFGNNYSAVAANYPKFRPRSGTVESIERRINDCLQRSLNGKALDSSSKEMRAMVAYISWVGSEVPKGTVPPGAGLPELSLLERPADPEKGRSLFTAKCISCHQENGQGVANVSGNGYTYPPLWGDHSYNTGAGLFRLSRFAGYIKANMPLGATADRPQLTDEEAWDIAAFVNSQPRPVKDLSGDWPDISKKPFDHPFGPYADGFGENQHKYGPFGPIKQTNQKDKDKTKKS